jgi:hypothetical protein
MDGAARKLRPSESAMAVGNENVTAELLRLWHRDERYLDSEAKPRPLSLDKGRNNLRATIRRINRNINPDEVLGEIRAVKLIKKLPTGKFIPTSQSAIVGKLHPLAIDHVAKIVIQLVGTMSRNVNASSSVFPLIERHAYAPDLKWDERKAFAQFSRSQGMACLESIDNWLESKRSRHDTKSRASKAPGIPAGVHIFAYMGDAAASAHKSRRSRAGPRKRVVSASKS